MDSTIQLREAKTHAKDYVDRNLNEFLARIKHHMWESYGFIFSQGKNLVNVLKFCEHILISALLDDKDHRI